MEGLDLFMKTLQEIMGSHYESILSALSSQSQALQEIEKRETIINSETVALRSFVLALQESLESMKSQQSEGYEKICEKLSWLSDNLQFNEILSLLNKLSSACKPMSKLKDSTVQTSPGLYEKLCLVRQEKTYFETTRVCRTSSIQTHGALAAGQGGDGESSFENRPVDNISQQCYGRGSQVPMAKTKQSPVRYAEPPKQQICRENCKDNSLESSLLYRVPYQTHSASTTATFPRIPVSVSSNQNVQPALKKQQSDQQATSNGMNVFKAQTAMNTLEQKKDLYDFETQTKINQGFKSKGKHAAIDNSPGFERINKKAIGSKKACKRQPAFQNRHNACTSKKKRKVNILKFSQSQSKKQIQALEEHEDCGADTQKSRGIFENKVGGVSIAAKNLRYQNSELKEKLIPMCYIRKSVVKTTEDAGRCILESTNASKVMNNLWDSSSQESGHTQGIAGFEKQAHSWISPVMHRPPCPAVNATKTQDMQKSKMRSRICMFDTSDDSD
ncbi:uncharacterized protein LOC131701536 [Acipenser ruthenus]|uniref:uncharacterized protein LOC131701536 n=1 Tax=Acipenser ruthenus TaxID=7906 RepID=UPI0027428E65|nr:uncharacterized protein LOC131701536 [Acipenser ruthenus]